LHFPQLREKQSQWKKFYNNKLTTDNAKTSQQPFHESSPLVDVVFSMGTQNYSAAGLEIICDNIILLGVALSLSIRIGNEHNGQYLSQLWCLCKSNGITFPGPCAFPSSECEPFSQLFSSHFSSPDECGRMMTTPWKRFL